VALFGPEGWLFAVALFGPEGRLFVLALSAVLGSTLSKSLRITTKTLRTHHKFLCLTIVQFFYRPNKTDVFLF
jgi:hypothetical protein